MIYIVYWIGLLSGGRGVHQPPRYIYICDNIVYWNSYASLDIHIVHIYIVDWNSYASLDIHIVHIYIVYWNSYAVFNDYRQLRIPLPLTKRQMMLAKDVGLGRCTC